MFSIVKHGKLVAVMSSNVGGLLYGSLPEAEEEITDIRSAFAVKQTHEGEFRFCGKEAKRLEDMNIMVTAQDNGGKIRPIDYGAKKLTDKLTQCGCIACMGSPTGTTDVALPCVGVATRCMSGYHQILVCMQ